MAKIVLKKPLLICLFGVPGSGKSYVAANLAKSLQIANVSADKIRGELFPAATLDQAQSVANKLALYNVKEFLAAGASVVYDGYALSQKQRKSLKDLASRHKAGFLLIWLQIDEASALARAISRDKRTMEGRYSQATTQDSFNRYISHMEAPREEDYLVVSGKHTYSSQKSVIINRLYQLGYIDSSAVGGNITKPELVNLIPNVPRSLPEIGNQNLS